jgi:hypothetical protein
MPRVKKVVEPVLIEPVVDIEDTEEIPLEPPKLKRSRTRKAKTPEEPAVVPVVEPVVVPAVEAPSGKKENMWVAHVQKVRSANEGMSYKEAMKLAKETYYK